MPDLRVNFTISRFEGGFEGLTHELINNLLRLSAPALLEAAWPNLEPVVIEMIYGVRNNMAFIKRISIIYETCPINMHNMIMAHRKVANISRNL